MDEDSGTSTADQPDAASSTPTHAPAVEGTARVLRLQRNGVPRSHRERRYPCSMCSEVFTRQEHRRRHELSHQDERPFACSLCSFKATRKDVILRHTRSKHPESAAGNSERTAESILSPSDADASGYTPSPRSHHSRHDSIAGSSMVSGGEQRLEDAEATGSGSGLGSAANGSYVLDPALSPLPYTIMSTASGASLNPMESMNSMEPWNFAEPHMPHGAAVAAQARTTMQPAAGPIVAAAATTTTTVPQIEFQFLDDYLFQWLAADYMQMPAWSDGLMRLPMDQHHLQHLPHADDRGEYQSSGLFWELTAADMAQVELRLQMHDGGHRLGDFRLPSRYTAIRYIKAFFAYFLPHTPVVHAPTFHVGTCSMPLLLAIMACGAIHVNEPEVGTVLHHAVLKLLSESDSSGLVVREEPELQLWELQTRLLACQFGLFSGDRRLRREAQACLLTANKPSSDSWHEWILAETVARCVAWVNTLSAVLLCDDDETPAVHLAAPYIDTPLPCAEAQWTADAVVWQSWSREGGPGMLSKAFQCLLDGTPLGTSTSISPFGMLVLVSALLSQICIMNATNATNATEPEKRQSRQGTVTVDDESRMQTALATWEEAWKVHPQSTTLPDAPHGPLMADSILLLNTAYGRLYAHTPLREMRALARLPPGPLPAERVERLYGVSGETYNGEQSKPLVRACRSLLIRVRLGMRHMAKTASLTYACYGPLPAYEGSLLIAWHCLGQTLGALPRSSHGDPMVTRMLDEIVAESQYAQHPRVQRETIAMVLYRDLIRERWIWQSCNSIAERLDNTIQTFQLLLARHGVP
ncbi:hypothetical protein SCUCBS95973_003187 [Sporothrix curviconia]|uniref:C2H2-type domain-containing protein n=1 Tax=Sporothrix curviconia TaxID=1260050 RepID=A0ABP0BD37_9PEZI